MGEVILFKGKDRCWRCEINESVYLLEDKKRTIGLCCNCADPEYSACLSGDLTLAAKFFIPISDHEHRRFSESTHADIDACMAYLRALSARTAKDAEVSRSLLSEAKRLGINKHQPLIPFLKQMAALNWISEEGRKCLDYALARWDMNELIPVGRKEASRK